MERRTMEYVLTEEPTAETIVYGVALCADGATLKEAPALTDSRLSAEALVRLLNELMVEPCHFEDIVEDYLTDFTI
ncbi:MAG: hypothetical protein II629_03835 [Ruminococcus sp.]|nr:hypothetical protein [Ruminococcus sp.]MBQ3987868.1 hypothetical protein [Ruminococcus sp.]MBQ5744546.1 hypothetical protein [Ruminococcus sp.]MEE0952704.1 DUF6514 family protein [Ruminococcus sp.]MEE1106075.1 DUF6514 family protein [Ruminococcus sp.]